MEIREERPADVAVVRKVNEAAFGRPDEADLVDALRRNCREAISLVAVVEGSVVGHILFTPVMLEGKKPVEGAGLGPMAVLPSHQNRGVGQELVGHGLAKLRAAGCPFVVVLGHREYYPRFGFQRASEHGISCTWEVPDWAFMAMILDAKRMDRVSGVARYRNEFSEAS
ncbi:MAG: N-acetyltransferase [Gemmatimonadota bacterium]|nr:N-acetyltransferase [Gemmatimonadota bacterium]